MSLLELDDGLVAALAAARINGDAVAAADGASDVAAPEVGGLDGRDALDDGAPVAQGGGLSARQQGAHVAAVHGAGLQQVRLLARAARALALAAAQGTAQEASALVASLASVAALAPEELAAKAASARALDHGQVLAGLLHALAELGALARVLGAAGGAGLIETVVGVLAAARTLR
eukprot:TRINITY_DN12492_c0_g1_i1.p2 TRINITY_DN12492_c0_g1~~TRINITY_DN12492_c0_g1_i1.p2  ORF type:complete len:176 (+),score=13.02 TRINITY_DN12492_c0_g1_i1:540-1067(+)